MNCEQVKELLSAYLDDMLAPQEHDAVALHLQECSTCSSILADFSHFDALLAQLPRVSPAPAQREKLFSSPEFLELTGTLDGKERVNQQDPLSQRTLQETGQRPRLVALPGGRSSSSLPALTERATPTSRLMTVPHPAKRAPSSPSLRWQQAMQIAAVAAVLLTLSIGSLISWNLWQQQARQATTPGGITPPAAPQQTGPIPAGMRFVFLRDGTLWSGASDGSTPTVRLTPPTVTVATTWAVRPPLPGHRAGNVLAYIDLQHGFIHTIRSDGQSDSVIQQPLLKAGISPASVWDTDTGRAILESLTWSQDGTMLAFVADPTGTGQTALYLYMLNTGQIHRVDFPNTDRVFHPVWSPDGVRIAVGYTHHGVLGILDYNTQNHGILTIAPATTSASDPNDTLLTLAWSPDPNTPALTWSVGSAGHVHTIWLRRINTSNARMLATGDYTQATYSPAGHNEVGSWLLVTSQMGHPGDLLRVDLDLTMKALTSGKQVYNASWSPNGMYVDYFDALFADIGTLHTINLSTGSDTLVATGIVADPAPAWSADSQSLLYSTDNHLFVLHKQVVQQLKLQGPTSALSWSATSPHQAIVAVGDGQEGMYIVDTQSNAVIQIDKADMRGPILWSEIP